MNLLDKRKIFEGRNSFLVINEPAKRKKNIFYGTKKKELAGIHRQETKPAG